MARKKGIIESYFLAFAGFFGLAGLHRFYLGKPVSGFFYLITGGFAGIGTIIDLFQMRGLVDNTNRRLYLEQQLDADDYEEGRAYRVAAPQPQIQQPQPKPRPEARSLEHLAFILAEENGGILTAAQLALESGVPAQQAKDELEQMLLKGFATVAERRNGLEVYVFREFLTDAVRSDLLM